MRDANLMRAVWNTPWMILPAKHREIAAVVARHVRGEKLSEEVLAAFQAAAAPQERTADTVAILPLYGIIGYRMDLIMAMSGGTSVQRFTNAFRAAVADASVKAILLDVDSPGGSVDGVDELSKEIYQARGAKPIVAIANPMAASAAYYIASAADELVVMPSGSVGSIGVVVEHIDDSAMQEMVGIKSTVLAEPEYKAELWGPLTEDAKARLENVIGQYYSMFKKAVARNRGISVADVEKKYGEYGPGRMLTAQEALKVGMVDRVATFDETLARLVGRKGAQVSVRVSAGASDDPPLSSSQTETTKPVEEAAEPSPGEANPVQEPEPEPVPESVPADEEARQRDVEWLDTV